MIMETHFISQHFSASAFTHGIGCSCKIRDLWTGSRFSEFKRKIWSKAVKHYEQL